MAELGEGPLVVLLHGFPQFWWAWRHQLTGLADAGYRVAAMDLRGYGALRQAAARLRHLHPRRRRRQRHPVARREPAPPSSGTAGAAGSPGRMPTPAAGRDPRGRGPVDAAPAGRCAEASFTSPAQIRANGYLGGLQRPFVPEHQMTSGGYVQRLLRAWAAPGGGWPTPDVARRYADAMALPFVAHSAAEYYRWVVRSQVRPDGWRFVRRVQRPMGAGRCTCRATRDGAVAAPSTARLGGLRRRPVRGARLAGRGALPARGGAGRGQRPPRAAGSTARLSRAGQRTWLSPRRSAPVPTGRRSRSGPASAPARASSRVSA